VVKQLQIYFFGLPTKILGILGPLIYHWKALENTLPTVYNMPPPPNVFKLQSQKKKNCNRLVIAYQGGQ
jgi:hypothetical protein